MKFHNKLFFLLFFAIYDSNAQQINCYDGIELQTSTSNRENYFYGEPFQLYFELENTESSPKKFYIPFHGINFRVKLIDLNNNKEISINLDYWNINSSTRDRFRSTPPENVHSFEGHEKIFLIIPMNSNFAKIKLIKNEITGISTLRYNLFAIPKGEYELTMEYYLFPSDKILSSKIRFKIGNIPDDEKQAFENYIKATHYANENHYDGKRNYSPKHQSSYENFLRKYPSSIFSQYAMLDMTNEIYGYIGPSSALKLQRYNEFLDYYCNITERNIMFYYAALIPKVCQRKSRITKVETVNELDKHLQKLKNDKNASQVLIQVSKRRYKIMGLKNYAIRDADK